MKTTQITITEENDWEGETFSYILDVDEETFNKIKEGIAGIEELSLVENTTFSKNEVKRLNKESKNCYMARYQFCELKESSLGFLDDWYASVFYKGVGLHKL